MVPAVWFGTAFDLRDAPLYTSTPSFSMPALRLNSAPSAG